MLNIEEAADYDVAASLVFRLQDPPGSIYKRDPGFRRDKYLSTFGSLRSPQVISTYLASSVFLYSLITFTLITPG